MKLIAIELIIFFQDDTFCSKEYIQKQAEELYRHLHEHEDYGEQL